MKKYFFLLILSIFLFASCEKEEDPIIDLNAEKQLPKIEVCHYDEYTDTWETLSISENALKAHLAHGDFEGSCEDRKTYVPDDSLEQYFICTGFDDVLDDYVLTSNLEKVTSIGVVAYRWLKGCYIGGSNEISVGPPNSYTGIEDCINLKYLSIGGDYAHPFGGGFSVRFIDLSNNPNLEYIDIYTTSPSFINLKNGNNSKITHFQFTELNREASACIQVDDVHYSNQNWTDISSNVTFSEDCGY